MWATELARLDDDRYLCAAQVPRAHSLLSDQIGPRYDYYDLAFLAEMGRQAGISAMHHYLDVPTSHATVFMKLGVTVDAPVPNERPALPPPVLVHVEFPNRERHDGVVTAVGFRMRYDVDGVHRATATGLAAAYEPGDYKQLRAEIRADKPLADRVPAPPPALPAERVGRRNPDNVLVGALQPGPDPDRFTAPVRVDQLHPHFFEHPMEHVPGVLMLEAFRQMSLAAVGERHGLPAAGTVVLDSSTRFPGFAELELPLHCEARVGQPGDPRDGHVTVPLRLTLRQPGTDDVAIGRMTLRCPAS